jgi:hypothetical protein
VGARFRIEEFPTGQAPDRAARLSVFVQALPPGAGRQILTAAEPVPDDLAEALTKINAPTGAH